MIRMSISHAIATAVSAFLITTSSASAIAASQAETSASVAQASENAKTPPANAGAANAGTSNASPADTHVGAAPAENPTITLPNKSVLTVSGRTVSITDPAQGTSQTFSLAPSPIEDRICGLRSTYSGDPKTVWIELVRKSSAISDWNLFADTILVPDSIKPIKGEVKIEEEDDAAHDALARKTGSLPQGLKSADRRFLTLMGSSLYELRNAGYTHVSYKVATRRIDTVVSDASGKISIISGASTELAPEPPEIPAGQTALCNIYVPAKKKPVTAGDIVAIGPKTAVDPVLKERNHAALSKTLKKISSGEQVNVVFWGDSITVGGFATEQKASFVERFLKMLKSSYPDSKVGYVVAAISGSNTSMRLASFPKEVVALKPDLVCVEFFNDFVLPQEQVEANWKSIISQLKAAGIEVLICAPHLPSPSYLKMDSVPQVADSFYPAFLRKLAKEQNVALADVSRRWANLQKEGIKPTRLLSDGIIHPNNYGHSVYASEIMTSLTGERAL
jgi:lysophospholipase L1-like esterase